MANNEIQRSRDEGLDLSDVDWSWLQFTKQLREYAEEKGIEFSEDGK